MDLTYIGSLDRKFTYKYPLIIQLFPKTENKNSWFSNIFLLYVCNILIKLLKLDERIDGWFLLYFVFSNYIIIIKLLLLIIIGSILHYNVNKLLLVKSNIV